jgi:molybdopterin molybdotransferase
MISVEEALPAAWPLSRRCRPKTVPLAQAAGRVDGAPAVATARPAALCGLGDGRLCGAGRPGAGRQFHRDRRGGRGPRLHGTVGPGQAVRIFTGAPVPEGATRVVIQEDVVREWATGSS